MPKTVAIEVPTNEMAFAIYCNLLHRDHTDEVFAGLVEKSFAAAQAFVDGTPEAKEAKAKAEEELAKAEEKASEEQAKKVAAEDAKEAKQAAHETAKK